MSTMMIAGFFDGGVSWMVFPTLVGRTEDRRRRGEHQPGGSKRAAALAVIGSLVWGIVGMVLPVPMVGTLIGACRGAFAGSLIGDFWVWRRLFPSFEAVCGAAVSQV